MNTPKTWIITGASRGIGYELASLLLNNGHNVIATSRRFKNLEEVFKDPSETFLPLEVDIQSEESIATAVAKAIQYFGQIDFLVNNAGYGSLGAIEEIDDAEVQRQFDSNVFGPLRVIRAVLPHLRVRKSGHIINVTSIGGLTTFPSAGIYHGSKFAL